MVKPDVLWYLKRFMCECTSVCVCVSVSVHAQVCVSVCVRCASLKIGICVTSVASFSHFHYTQHFCKRLLSSWYLWPIFGSLLHDWCIRSAAHWSFKAVSKWCIFLTMDLKNSFALMLVARWWCCLCACCYFFCFSVCVCAVVWRVWMFHGNADNFHF